MIIPVLLLPVLIFILFPVLVLVAGILVLGFLYFVGYMLQIMLGVGCMAASMPFQGIFYILMVGHRSKNSLLP